MSNILQKRGAELGLSIIIIILSGASASFVIFGPLDLMPYATYRDVAIIPSVIVIFTIGILCRSKFPRITNRLFVGMAAGGLATFLLEAIRIPGYMFVKWLPADSMISLPGLLLTEKITSLGEIKQVIMQSGVAMNLYHAPLDAFMAGALWHFWNGATFGIVYALFIGKGKWWYGLIWATIVEIVMMIAPYLVMMVGPFGVNYQQGYNIFVITLVAHLAFGAVLGVLVQKWKKGSESIFNI